MGTPLDPTPNLPISKAPLFRRIVDEAVAASPEENVRLIVSVCALTGLTYGGYKLSVALSAVLGAPLAQSELQKHLAATIGVPLSAFAALWLVIALRISDGPIELEAFGIKIKGASGPALLWLICFLGMATAIKFLWATT